MSAPDLLVVIDPAARHDDAEAVRIARDVLCAGAPGAKVCMPQTAAAAERALARRGHRKAVVVGDDQALTYAVRALHPTLGRPGTETSGGPEHQPGGRADGSGEGPVDRTPEDSTGSVANLAFVPVGRPEALELVSGLGLSTDVVTAARAVLSGTERVVGLLVDDSDALLIGGLRIPVPRGPEASPSEGECAAEPGASAVAGGPSGSGPAGVLESLSRRAGFVRSARRFLDGRGTPLPRLRVEVDGVLLGDPERPVTALSVSALADGVNAGLAEVVLRHAPLSPAPRNPLATGPGNETETPAELRATARAVTVSGPGMAPRTWRVAPSTLRLTVPSQAVPEPG